jgi:hypothetical protein
LLAPSALLVAVALGLLGAANATLDVAMNVQGVAVETALGRPALSGFHGLFSLGGLTGAASGEWRDGRGHRGGPTRGGRDAGKSRRPSGLRGGLLPTPLSTDSPRPALAWPSRRLLGLGRIVVLRAAGGGRDG